MNLIDQLNQVTDPRRKQGQRFPLTTVLLIIIMGIISGRYGYREITVFSKANQKDLIKNLRIKHKRIPSHVTIRDVIMRIDFDSLNNAFYKWASAYVKIEKNDWLSIDGKSIKSTVEDYDKSYQNFVCLVSVFSQKQAQVVKSSAFENKKTSEISVVQQLIEILDIKDAVITLDALHCKKNSKSNFRQPKQLSGKS
jgi:hypothetical protein